MSVLRKLTFIVFFVLLIVDLYNCLSPGQEVSKFLRPVQMAVLFLLILPKFRFSFSFFLIALALLISSMADYFFYKYGPTYENKVILLIMLKNLCLIGVFYPDIRDSLRPSKRLYRWFFNYLFITIGICFLMSGFENWLPYIIAIQSGIILLFISLQKNDSGIFKQMYLGYSLIILSLIFGKILLTDSRWFVEAISRCSLVMGHLLFISGLAKIKLVPIKSNIFGYQVVE